MNKVYLSFVSSPFFSDSETKDECSEYVSVFEEITRNQDGAIPPQLVNIWREPIYISVAPVALYFLVVASRGKTVHVFLAGILYFSVVLYLYVFTRAVKVDLYDA